MFKTRISSEIAPCSRIALFGVATCLFAVKDTHVCCRRRRVQLGGQKDEVRRPSPLFSMGT